MKPTFLTRLGLCLAVAGALSGSALFAQPGGFGGGGRGNSGRNNNSGTTTYPSSTDIGQARVTYDAETRSIIVVADDETGAHIKDLVAQLDRPTPQVLIKCVFLEATYSKDLDVGTEGTYSHTISGSSLSALNTPPGQKNTASTAYNLARTVGSTAGSGGLYNLIGQDLNVTISALAKAGKTEILSRPSILARNNQQATINVGQRVPLISGVTYDSFGNQRNAITYTDVGIILQVTPFITSDGMVEMIVAPEVSSVSDSSVTFTSGFGTNNAGGSSAPIINTRSADTVVVVPNGQPVVIGGLMQASKISSENKVPLLGDIPLLGWLFKHKVSNDGKSELLIFLTPHIVKDPRDLAALSEAEKANSQQAPKAFSEQELNRYLDTVPTAPTPAPKVAPAPATKPAKAPKSPKASD